MTLSAARDPILLVGVRGGVGGEVARRLIAAGHAVIGTVRDEGQFQEVRQALPGLADLIALDLDDADAARAVLSARFAEAPLAGVIVCAAICTYGPLETIPLAVVRRELEVNAVACLAVYQACMPALRRTRGRFVFVSSYSGKVALPFLGAYKASKFALEALGDVMRMEAAKWGVKVVLVLPGGIATEMPRGLARRIADDLADLPPREAELYGDLYESMARALQGVESLTPAGVVADTVVEAYQAQDPEPRYPVGEDTKFLLAKRQELSDREMDALARELYGLAPL
jgi:NAD(P)-dependent dehydrogenase (short-subunit alcohol dehydrogenase family)